MYTDRYTDTYFKLAHNWRCIAPSLTVCPVETDKKHAPTAPRRPREAAIYGESGQQVRWYVRNLKSTNQLLSDLI